MNPQLFFYGATIQHSLPFFHKETETNPHTPALAIEGWKDGMGVLAIQDSQEKEMITVTDKREIRQQHT